MADGECVIKIRDSFKKIGSKTSDISLNLFKQFCFVFMDSVTVIIRFSSSVDEVKDQQTKTATRSSHPEKKTSNKKKQKQKQPSTQKTQQ